MRDALLDEKKTIIIRRLAFYSGLLTETQRSISGMYFEEDYSFSEIAELCGISRQAACDTVHKTVRLLDKYEKALGLQAQSDWKKTKLNAALQAARSLNCDPEQVKFREMIIQSVQELLMFEETDHGI